MTARLDESVVEALDEAVRAGLGPSRGWVVASAVREWLERHGEDAIVASYRRRYEARDGAHDDLVAALAQFSLAACLAEEPQLIHRGDIWDAEIPGVGIHPVIVTRDSAIPVLSSLLCVLVTSTFHHHVAEVASGTAEGLRHDSAANCDNVFTLTKRTLSRQGGRLDSIKIA